MASHALTHQPFGYRKKPVRVFLVAIYLLIAPWVYFVLNIRELGDPTWGNPDTWLKYLTDLHPRVWFLLTITFAAAIMLFLVRKASWILAIIALVLVIIYNIFVFGSLPIPAIILLAFVLFTPFRKPYLNPQLRWWEQLPRFDVDLFANVEDLSAQLHIYDISEGGVLAEFLGETHPKLYDTFHIEFSNGPKLLTKLVRIQENKYLGLHFEELSRGDKRLLKKFIKTLRRRGEAKSRR